MEMHQAIPTCRRTRLYGAELLSMTDLYLSPDPPPWDMKKPYLHMVADSSEGVFADVLPVCCFTWVQHGKGVVGVRKEGV